MAKLFLSYSRKNARPAERLTHWLESQGHDVWRDEDDIGGGTSFSSEIERALEDCDAVLVLWSTDSAQSAWVRDEAGYGRDRGKLIPLSLDGSEPPLGFRQFQSIDISKWKGSGAPPNAERLKGAIARVTGLAQTQPTAPAPTREWPPSIFGKPLLVVGALAILVAIALALFLWQRWSREREVAIAVVPSAQSPNPAMAADYANVAAADMAALLPRRFDQATVIAPGDLAGQKSAYRIEISTDSHGAAANATLTLSGEGGHATLWSKNWSVADASAADLKAQVSTFASKAALCLMDAIGGSTRLSQPALGLYLTGCAGIGEQKLSEEDYVSMFDRVTKLAPGFGPGWDYLALSRSWIAEELEGSSPVAQAAAVQSAKRAIAIARRLNPSSAMSYDAEYHLISNDMFRGLQVLEKGASVDPDDPRIQMHLSEKYMSVGRMSDSVQAAQRAVELEPGSPYLMQQYIFALTYSGEFLKAKAKIAEARNKWPNDPDIALAEFSYQLRYGDPKMAQQLVPKMADSDADIIPFRKLLEARLNPTPSKVDDAVAALNARWGGNPRTRGYAFRALGAFGRIDEAYQLLDDPAFQPSIEPDVLFRPDFAGVRADPRFMQVAARLGLVRYWRQSGYWPDFCSNERLPYDCKKEAAKYQ